MLEARGYPVYDCDSKAKRLMVRHPDIIREMRQLLGNDVYLPSTAHSSANDDAPATYELNKPLIADYLFQSAENSARINAIVHPRVKDDFLQWAQNQTAELVFVESAILCEAHFLDVLDAVLLVSAPYEIRLHRAMTRDGAAEAQIRQRMTQQQSQHSMRQFATFELVNDGVNDISSALDSFLQKLQES